MISLYCVALWNFLVTWWPAEAHLYFLSHFNLCHEYQENLRKIHRRKEPLINGSLPPPLNFLFSFKAPPKLFAWRKCKLQRFAISPSVCRVYYVCTRSILAAQTIIIASGVQTEPQENANVHFPHWTGLRAVLCGVGVYIPNLEWAAQETSPYKRAPICFIAHWLLTFFIFYAGRCPHTCIIA